MKEPVFFLVSTPIGNLEDLSARAARILSEADTILAEDTRNARVLLARHGISTPVRSFHEHNEDRIAPAVIEELKGGRKIALIADAGTPVVSDPGYRLVRRLIEEGIGVTAIPGPSAVLAALVLSGLPPDRFTFFGYMPRKDGDRTRVLEEAGRNPYTSIFFESPHRLVQTLETASAVLGDREVVVARELTKLHEEVRRGDAATLAAHFTAAGVRGEITLLIRGTGRRRKAE